MTLKEFCMLFELQENSMHPRFRLYKKRDGKRAYVGEFSAPDIFEGNSRIHGYSDCVISRFPCTETQFGVEIIIPSDGSIVGAVFTSVWNGGVSVFSTPCMVNMLTKEVFDIGPFDDSILSAGTLDREYITLDDGTKIPVYDGEYEAGPDDFWY